MSAFFKIAFLCLISLFSLLVPITSQAQKEATKAEILHHGATIRQAFSEEDTAKIKALHHPEVIKALGYDDLKMGRAAVMEGLQETLKNFRLEFIENEVESILIQGDIAIEQTKFSIKGTSKNDGGSFVFKGRTMVTYLKYDKSPTGWATIREIIQPASQ